MGSRSVQMGISIDDTVETVSYRDRQRLNLVRTTSDFIPKVTAIVIWRIDFDAGESATESLIHASQSLIAQIDIERRVIMINRARPWLPSKSSGTWPAP